MKNKKYIAALSVAGLAVAVFLGAVPVVPVRAAYRFSDFKGKPPIHVTMSAAKTPAGITPREIKKVYNLPLWGGSGTIAIIDAYDDATIEQDLGVFDAAYGLAPCTVKDKCLEKHMMATGAKSNGGWALETSLDVEWAHAIAPQAKILLVEAKTESGANLLGAIDYAVGRKDVVAVSMSWGGDEFPDELSYDPHFVSKYGAVFFASSGDSGAGVSWPAVSPSVVGVGGTALTLARDGSFVWESAWPLSGGGVSTYEKQPDYQKTYAVPKANGMRAVPDVSYNADPASGYSVYRTIGTSKNGWYTIGGTSAGAAQWAAIYALGHTATLAAMYADKASSGTLKFFRDIASGANGTCKYYCDARKRYDYVTGLGSPQTVNF